MLLILCHCFIMESLNTNKNKGFRRINSMNKKRTVLAQMQQLISRFHFEKLANEHNKNSEDNKIYDYITNNFKLSASTISNIQKSRWDIELFFKWMKQNLKITTFIGTSENAVLIQVWIAAIMYLLTEYLRFISKIAFSRMETFRIISVNIFASRNLMELLSTKFQCLKKKLIRSDVQMNFGF